MPFKKIIKFFIIIFFGFCFFSIINNARAKVLLNEDDIENINDLESAIDDNPVEAAKLLESIDADTMPADIKDIIIHALPVKNRSFQAGEEIEFSVKYGIINVGNAVFSVNKSLDIYGRAVLAVTSDARTNSFFDAVYRVRDRIVSYIDAEKLFSYKYIKVQREGGKKINEMIRYNYPKNIATRYRSRLKKNSITHNKSEIELTKPIFDPFAALYYLRSVDFKVGDTVKIPVSSSTEIYELGIKIIKTETLKTKIGRINCYKVRPILLKEGIFIHKGDMDIWFTADSRKIPVRMKGEMLFGSINATIDRYREK